MLEKYINEIRQNSRTKKSHQLLPYVKAVPTDKILEVRVTDREYSPVDNFLLKNYPFKNKITALGIGNLSEFKQKYPEIRTISYDGKKFPFADREFDIAHLNAVIEHVGDFSA